MSRSPAQQLLRFPQHWKGDLANAVSVFLHICSFLISWVSWAPYPQLKERFQFRGNYYRTLSLLLKRMHCLTWTGPKRGDQVTISSCLTLQCLQIQNRQCWPQYLQLSSPLLVQTGKTIRNGSVSFCSLDNMSFDDSSTSDSSLVSENEKKAIKGGKKSSHDLL